MSSHMVVLCLNFLEQEADSERHQQVDYCANTVTYWPKKAVLLQWKLSEKERGGHPVDTQWTPSGHPVDTQPLIAEQNFLPKAEASPYTCVSVFIESLSKGTRL